MARNPMIPRPEMVEPSLLRVLLEDKLAWSRGLQCADDKSSERSALPDAVRDVPCRARSGVRAGGTVGAGGRLFQFAQDSRSEMVWEWLARVRASGGQGSVGCGARRAAGRRQ